MSSLTINSCTAGQPGCLDTTSPTPAHDTMILLDKFKVDTEFFELVESRFEEIYPALLAHVDYTPVDLIGEPLWADLTGLAQRQAVHCLSHLATLAGARLFEHSPPGCGTTSFQIAFTSTQSLS